MKYNGGSEDTHKTVANKHQTISGQEPRTEGSIFVGTPGVWLAYRTCGDLFHVLNRITEYDLRPPSHNPVHAWHYYRAYGFSSPSARRTVGKNSKHFRRVIFSTSNVVHEDERLVRLQGDEIRTYHLPLI